MKRGYLMLENLVVIAVLAIAVLGTFSLIMTVTRAYMFLDPISSMRYKAALDKFEKRLSMLQTDKMALEFLGDRTLAQKLSELLEKLDNTFTYEGGNWYLNEKGSLVKEILLPREKKPTYAIVIDDSDVLFGLMGESYLELPGVDTNYDGKPDNDRRYDYAVVVVPTSNSHPITGERRMPLVSKSLGIIKSPITDSCKKVWLLVVDTFLIRKPHEDRTLKVNEILQLSSRNMLTYDKSTVRVSVDSNCDEVGLDSDSFEHALYEKLVKEGGFEPSSGDTYTDKVLYILR